jgi:4-amino-4-deoxy-L-arabinose transferase-like glycosyltransferase
MTETAKSIVRARPSLAMLALVAATAFALHAAFYAGYGWFRDELYFLACSEHLAWGFVDAPPGVPIVLWLSRELLGEGLFAARFVPIVFATLLVLLAGLTAHAMGGGRWAQALAALAVMAAPYWFVSYLNTDMFVNVGWAACAYLATRILAGSDPRLWLAAGAVTGLAFEGKHSMALFATALVAGVLSTPQRRLLRNRQLWAGVTIAMMIALPNVAWEIARGWPTLELLSNIAHSSKNVELGPLDYLLTNVVYLSPITLPLWGAGLLWCGFDRVGQRFRALAIAWAITFAVLVALKGKGYYLTPMFSPLFAAGAVAIESWILRRRAPAQRAWRIGVIAALLAGCVPLWPLAMPMLPVERFLAYQRALHLAPPRTETQPLDALPQQYADMFGWPELAAAVAAVYRSLPESERESCGIYASNYGEAGAIDQQRKALGLPPALSGHQNYWLWGARGYDGQCLVVVGGQRATLERWFEHVVQASEADHPYAVPGERHLPIWIVHGVRAGSFQTLWPMLKHWQ